MPSAGGWSELEVGAGGVVLGVDVTSAVEPVGTVLVGLEAVGAVAVSPVVVVGGTELEAGLDVDVELEYPAVPALEPDVSLPRVLDP